MRAGLPQRGGSWGGGEGRGGGCLSPCGSAGQCEWISPLHVGEVRVLKTSGRGSLPEGGRGQHSVHPVTGAPYLGLNPTLLGSPLTSVGLRCLRDPVFVTPEPTDSLRTGVWGSLQPLAPASWGALSSPHVRGTSKGHWSRRMSGRAAHPQAGRDSGQRWPLVQDMTAQSTPEATSQAPPPFGSSQPKVLAGTQIPRTQLLLVFRQNQASLGVWPG